MAVQILHKRSAVEFKNATGAQLELGELALNYNESGPYLQCKDAAGEIVQLGGVFVSAVAGDAPGNPILGKWWLRGDTLFLYNGTTWVEIGGGSGGGGGTPGTITVIGGDGIEATTIGTTITVTADISSSRGLEFSGDQIAVKLGAGLAFDADGKIESTISGGLSYKGTVDVTTATVISGAAEGDLYANTGTGKFSSQWAATTSNATTATDANPGDWVIYQGPQWDHIPTTVTGTDLGIANRDDTDLDVTSSTGADATIPAATTTLAGLMTAADKTALDSALQGGDVDLGYTPNGNNAGTVTNTAGDDATIPIATTAVAGLFTGAEKQKLAGIDADADVNPLAGRALTYDAATDPDTLNADIATASALGVVKVGDGIDVDAAGEISVSFPPSETYIGETPPASPAEGDLWWNSSNDSGRLYVYYEDADSSQWVEASPQGDTLTESDANGLYLSKTSDDTAAGAITFEQLTTHEVGVKVTGGYETDIVNGIGSRNTSDQRLYVFAGGEVPAQFAFDGTTVLGWGGVVAGKDPLTIRSDQAPSLAGSTNLISFQGRNSADVGSIFGKFGTILEENAGAGGGKAKFSFQLNSGGGIEEKASISSSGLGTFNGGVKVTGGVSETLKIISNGTGSITINDTNKAQHNDSTTTSVAHALVTTRLDNKGASAIATRALINLNYQNRNRVVGFQSLTNNDIRSTQFDLFSAEVTTPQTLANSVLTGFRSVINTSDHTGTNAETYNFYAAGTAPNYFAGQLFCSPNSLNVNFWNQFDRGFIKAYAGNNAIVSTGDKSYAPIQVSVGADFSTTKFLFSAQSGAGNGGSLVTASGGDLAFNNTSDYRVKTNIQTYSENASNKINALRLVSYTRTDFNIDVPIGFIAHELQEQIPEAVFGEKDKEVAIGTLADYDGTVLETTVVEPETEELEYTEEVEVTPYVAAVAATYDEYGNEVTAEVPEVEPTYTTVTRTKTWTPTGTQPVYQGVDQTKLIPLLTKALQEVLTKNEDLEARIAALEGA